MIIEALALAVSTGVPPSIFWPLIFCPLIFRRQHDFSVFFNSMGVEGNGSHATAFPGAALAGLFLFYEFEACGDVAEEVADSAECIPRAMILTISIGGVSSLFAFCGYVVAAPNLAAIVSGKEADPIPAILQAFLGDVGAQIFLLVALTAFLPCALSLPAAASRLLFSFAREGMISGPTWLARVSPRTSAPTNALIVACSIPVILRLIIFVGPDRLLTQITSFNSLGMMWLSTSWFSRHCASGSKARVRQARPATEKQNSWSMSRRSSLGSLPWCYSPCRADPECS